MAKFKLVKAAALTATAALVLAGCSGGGAPDPAPETPGGSETPSTSEPIKAIVFGGIGAEGILQNNATTSVTAALASVAAVNELGGIDGRQIEIEVIDDKADPTLAVTRLRELMNSADRPDVVMNSGPSTVADAIIPILSQEKIISFNIGPTETSSDPAASPYNFDLSPAPVDYIAGYIPVMEEKGYKNVAILNGSSAYGELFGKLTTELFSEAGFTITGNEGYDNAALDMTPQLESLKSGNPDVVILDAYGAPLGYVLQGFEKLGWDVPVMGNTSVSATGVIAVAPPEGVLGTDQVKNLTMQVFKSTKYDPSDARMVKAVEQMVAAGDIKSSLILAYNYDAMFLYKAAVESAGSMDPDAVAKALVDPKLADSADTAILQAYRYSPEVHRPVTDPTEYLFIAPGELVNGQFQ